MYAYRFYSPSITGILINHSKEINNNLPGNDHSGMLQVEQCVHVHPVYNIIISIAGSFHLSLKLVL